MYGPARADHVHSRLSPGIWCLWLRVTWKKGTTWKATRPTWAGARRHTTQSAQRLRWQRGTARQNSHHIHGRAGGHLEDDIRDPGPGQKYATMARKHIAALRAKEPGDAGY